MADRGEMWYPTLPDRTCPVCEIPVKYEKGYYDTKPVYRCNKCGLVTKPTSEGTMIAMICLGTFVAVMLSWFVGQAVIGISPPPAPPPGYAGTPPKSFFAPKPTPPGVAYSSGTP